MDNQFVVDPCQDCGSDDLSIKYRDYYDGTMIRAVCRNCGCDWEEILDPLS